VQYRPRALPRLLSAHLPFYYGWVVLACVCLAGFSRQGPAVATLSVFVTPMTEAFGWSRTALSGAVSLGGLLAAIASPFLGPFLDRNGARAVLTFAVIGSGVAAILLSLTPSLLVFYVLFCFARMTFAGPYDLGIYGAINNWFVRRRAFATSIATLAQMGGLMAMPLIAHFAISAADWRAGWVAVGLTVLTVGLLPVWFLLVRRPEDLGLRPDGDIAPVREDGSARPAAVEEPAFTRREALRTRTFWLLALFTLLVYPIQAGISLHQVPFLIERGLDATVAATVVSTFSLFSAISGLAYGFWPRSVETRFALLSVALVLASSALCLLAVSSAVEAYLGAALFGIGIGGLLTMLPLAWADYFGRRSFGAIRGAALTVQVLAQASGPLLSGVLRDLSGSYELSLETFAVLGVAGAVVTFLVRPPRHSDQ